MRKPPPYDVGGESRHEGHPRDAGGCKNLDCETHPAHPNSGNDRKQVQSQSVSKNNYEYKKLCACITHYADLIFTLASEDPMSAAELSLELGVSKPTVLKELNRLMKFDLVRRVSFENHVLYCTNGKFNSVIREILDL